MLMLLVAIGDMGIKFAQAVAGVGVVVVIADGRVVIGATGICTQNVEFVGKIYAVGTTGGRPPFPR